MKHKKCKPSQSPNVQSNNKHKNRDKNVRNKKCKEIYYQNVSSDIISDNFEQISPNSYSSKSNRNELANWSDHLIVREKESRN